MAAALSRETTASTAPAVQADPTKDQPATLSSWEAGVNSWTVDFISNNLVSIRFLELKAGETCMNVVKAVAAVFATLLLALPALAVKAVKSLTNCCTSTAPADKKVPVPGDQKKTEEEVDAKEAVQKK